MTYDSKLPLSCRRWQLTKAYEKNVHILYGRLLNHLDGDFSENPYNPQINPVNYTVYNALLTYGAVYMAHVCRLNDEDRLQFSRDKKNNAREILLSRVVTYGGVSEDYLENLNNLENNHRKLRKLEASLKTYDFKEARDETLTLTSQANHIDMVLHTDHPVKLFPRKAKIKKSLPTNEIPNPIEFFYVLDEEIKQLPFLSAAPTTP